MQNKKLVGIISRLLAAEVGVLTSKAKAATIRNNPSASAEAAAAIAAGEAARGQVIQEMAQTLEQMGQPVLHEAIEKGVAAVEDKVPEALRPIIPLVTDTIERKASDMLGDVAEKIGGDQQTDLPSPSAAVPAEAAAPGKTPAPVEGVTPVVSETEGDKTTPPVVT